MLNVVSKGFKMILWPSSRQTVILSRLEYIEYLALAKSRLRYRLLKVCKREACYCKDVWLTQERYLSLDYRLQCAIWYTALRNVYTGHWKDRTGSTTVDNVAFCARANYGVTISARKHDLY